MKRLLLIIFLAGVSSCSWAQLKEQRIKELLAAYAKQADFNVSAIKPNKEVLENAVRFQKGLYENPHCLPSAIKITVEDGKLFTQDTNKSTAPHYLKPEEYFSLRIEDADIEFTKDETGVINLVIRVR
jgi:hypothetical protein